jgi:hypothetical protein
MILRGHRSTAQNTLSKNQSINQSIYSVTYNGNVIKEIVARFHELFLFVLNTTFNNISDISWQSVLLVE